MLYLLFHDCVSVLLQEACGLVLHSVSKVLDHEGVRSCNKKALYFHPKTSSFYKTKNAMREGVGQCHHSCTDERTGSVGSSKVLRPLIDSMCISKMTDAIKPFGYKFAILILQLNNILRQPSVY